VSLNRTYCFLGVFSRLLNNEIYKLCRDLLELGWNPQDVRLELFLDKF
jgi:hypothetical protein